MVNRKSQRSGSLSLPVHEHVRFTFPVPRLSFFFLQQRRKKLIKRENTKYQILLSEFNKYIARLRRSFREHTDIRTVSCLALPPNYSFASSFSPTFFSFPSFLFFFSLMRRRWGRRWGALFVELFRQHRSAHLYTRLFASSHPLFSSPPPPSPPFYRPE